MHIKRLCTVLAAGLVLTLAVLWLLIGQGRAAPAAPTIRCVAPGGTGCAGPCQGACHASVQAAVDAAAPGDEIRVARGTYTGVQARSGMTQVVYIGQTVVIRGGYTTTNWTVLNPMVNPTTLDAQGQGRVVSIIGDISPTLEGLRITSGSTDYGGGMYVMNAHPVVSGCQVYSNTASNGGGGLYLYPGVGAMLMGNSIYSNTTAAGLGGGVYMYASDDIALTDNAIHNNTARGGGGIYLGDSANATLVGNVIDSNKATIYSGGGICVSASRHVTLVRNRVYQNTAYSGGGISLAVGDDATLIGNQVCSNTATYYAGGLHFDRSYTATLTGNHILGNTAGSLGGGALFVESRGVTLTNNVVAENRITGSGRGAGIYMENSAAWLLHTTLAHNSGGDGSGVHIAEWGDGHSIAALTNTILVSHTVGITVTAGNTATLESTLWRGNTTANWGGAGTISHSHDHTGDPRFAADGYHLLEGSAAIDRGVPADVATDVDGEPRVGAPDLGADEYVLQVYLPLALRGYLAGQWGRLANPGFENERIKTTLFFAGQARDGSTWYECSPTSNLGLFTVHPSDTRHLNWSASSADRDFALTQMTEAGINVVTMSSWGEDFLPCTTAWAQFAPMQTAPGAHDELFTAAAGKHLLIVPFIESRADWALRDEFPRWTDGRVAPGTVGQIVNLIDRYLENPAHPEWAGRWARVYDRDGQPRYAVALIHASSNRLAADDHAAFAAGFDLVAAEVFTATGVRAGFFIDPLPSGLNAPGVFRPSPEATGPYLLNTEAILGIQPFIPEIWVPGSPTEAQLIAWKRDFSQRWSDTGVPFLMDISPGYDAHIVFPGSIQYGFTPAWRDALTGMVADFGQDGLAFNSWNGYTEGMAAVPMTEHGDVVYCWLQTVCELAEARE